MMYTLSGFYSLSVSYKFNLVVNRELDESKPKKQVCGYCPVDKCLLDCEICNPKYGSKCNCD